MRYLVLVLLTLLMSIYVPAANATTCDIDTDGDVDRLDIRAITLARNTPAAGTDDPRDADSDGTITILDARTCVTRCTLAACAEPAPDLITVPELVGTSQSAAETAITGAGLTVGVVTLENSGTVPAGSVIRQEPAGGNDVAPGTAVNLVVSLGEELTSVPDIVGLSQSAAEATITGAGLVVGTITTENSDTVPAGDVISQDPASGTDVAPGTAVNLVVSLGEELVTVPSVVGVSQTAAESAITSAGLLVGSITTDNSDTVPAGDVISQNPVDGSVVAPGTVVDLVISIGEALIPTPNVVGLSQADAEIELLAVGLVLGSVTTATSDTVPAGAVISQTPPAGELVALSTTVDLVVSSGAAAEPGLIGGPPDGAAVAFIELVPPAPSPAEALGELFIFDRLLVSIEPDATVAEVNDAFRRHDALISASSPNTLRVTVQIERQPSMAALNTKVAAMRAEPAFYDVDLARRIGVTELPIFADKSDIDTYENELAPYFATKFPAVWNLRDRMLRTPDATNLSIVVSDYFPKYEHPELPTLIGSDLPRSNLHHGLGVTSVIAAGYDGTGLTGVIPVEPANPIYAIDVSPITTSDGVLETYSNLPPTGDLVINSSWNYKTSAPLTQEELLGVALDALDVKKFYASMTDRVLHVVAAGNESRLADTLSPYAIATKFDDPCDITTDPPASLPLTPKDLAYCEEYKAPLTDDLGEFLDNPLPNILIVGSAANDRSISSFSNFNYEVAANGEGIIVACADLSLDPTACIPFGRSGSTDITDFSQGTSFAAPQITGLTFIMQRLRPDVPLFLIELLILNSGDRADTLLSNAYSAVLELDRVPPGGGDALSGLDSLNVANSVRGAILDVRDHGGDPDTPAQDDAFTEVDLEAFIDAFIGDPLEEIDAEPGALNFSRFDLNGDGNTGGSNGTEFDLNNDGDYTTVSVVIGGELFTFDESNVTDGNILCYMTFASEFYEGSPEYRDIVFALFGADLCVPLDHGFEVQTSLEIFDLSLPGGWLYTSPGESVVLDDIIPNLDPITEYRGDFRAPASSNCVAFGERGSPRHSIGARAFGGNFYIPAVTNAPYVNNFGPVRDGCSNFIAFENGAAWINVTRRLDRRSGSFTFENESQMRISVPKSTGVSERTGFIEYFFIGTETAAGGPVGEIDFDFILELKFTSS